MMSNGEGQILYILGASGHGKVVADIAEQQGYSVKFYDDAYPQKTKIEHWPIYGTCADLISIGGEAKAIVAIGNNEVREEKQILLLSHGLKIISLIHPNAIVSQYASIGCGSVIVAGAIINAFASIGNACIINTGATVGHDCIVDDFTHICPNTALAGGSTVGRNTWVGIGSQVKQLITIGDHCLIGAGSTVVKNIPSNVTAFGSPAVSR